MIDEATNPKRPMGNTKGEVAAREAEALHLFKAGKGYVEIGRALGYTGDDDAVRATAWGIVTRALKKHAVDDGIEIRGREDARIDAMVASLWPIAMSDLSIVPQFEGMGKNRRPVRCFDEDPDEPDHQHFENESGVVQCYVIPDFAKLQAIDQCVKLGKRQADIHGTDFQHGLDARKQKLDEEQAKAILGIMQGIKKRLGLDEALWQSAVGETMRELHLIQGKKSA